MKYNKIAISGKANSGKNTLSEIIQSKCEYSSSYAFADPIKEIALQIFPFLDENILWGPSYLRDTKIQDLKEWGLADNSLSYRDVLLKIGENTKKSFGEDIWVNTIFHRIKRFKSKNPNHLIIISDVRFRNELEACKKEGFLLVRIKRDNVNRTNKENHVSEVDLNGIPDEEFSVIIENSSGIDNLNLQAQALFNTWISNK